MEVIFVRPDDLQVAEYNPRRMTEKQAKDLETSIRSFGLVDPIIVNGSPERKNIVIGGHQRLRIAKKLGFNTVPVVYLDLDLEREKELNLRLNKNTGEWDFDRLSSFDLEFLKEAGFSTNDLNLNIDKFEEKEESTEPSSAIPITMQCPACGHTFEARKEQIK